MHTVAISTIEFGITFTGDTGDVKDFHTFNANRGRRQMILGLPGYKSNVTNKQKTYWYLDNRPYLCLFLYVRAPSGLKVVGYIRQDFRGSVNQIKQPCYRPCSTYSQSDSSTTWWLLKFHRYGLKFHKPT